ncbi:MAG: amidophosphoribosyltransferase, partial [Nitrospinae bacterium CG11_big_fil_rev_8_21_14_0_20_56_8]
AGAREVHLRICSPPGHFSCFYGIDTPTKNELIASTHDIEAIRAFLLADSVHYLSLEKMMGIFGDGKERFCTACFNGEYPVPVEDQEPDVSQMSLFPFVD